MHVLYVLIIHLLDKVSYPPYILKCFEATPAAGKTKTQHQREVLSQLFQRGENGRWETDFTKPCFQEQKQIEARTFHKSQQKGEARMMLEARLGDRGTT